MCRFLRDINSTDDSTFAKFKSYQAFIKLWKKWKQRITKFIFLKNLYICIVVITETSSLPSYYSLLNINGW